MPARQRPAVPTASAQLEALLGRTWPFSGRPPKHDLARWIVTDDWPDPVPVTQEMGDDPMHVMMRQIMALFDEDQSKENAKHVTRSMTGNARRA
jgi:hypothetical protein